MSAARAEGLLRPARKNRFDLEEEQADLDGPEVKISKICLPSDLCGLTAGISIFRGILRLALDAHASLSIRPRSLRSRHKAAREAQHGV